MGTTVKDGGGGGVQINHPDSGTYVARCFAIVFIGTIETEFQGKKAMRSKLELWFELPTETFVFKEEIGEQPFIVRKELTNTTNKGGDLCKILKIWSGGKVDEKNIGPHTDEKGVQQPGFDLAKMLGKPCQVGIEKKKAEKSGRDYLKFISISALAKGQVCPPMINEPFIFDVEEMDKKDMQEVFVKRLGTQVQEKIASSQEFKSFGYKLTDFVKPKEDKADEGYKPSKAAQEEADTW